MKTPKTFTWADMKKAANKVPEKFLGKQVIIWADDGEKGYAVTAVQILEEDYVFDGDVGCAPKSVMKEAIEEAKKTGDENEYYLIHRKGTRIICTD